MRIQVDGVGVDLGGVPVLDGVDATVESGEFVGLVGPNGAGKTTLLRTVNAALAPDRGEVRVGGDRVQSLPSKAASRRVATVPQETTLSFDFPVRDLVEMGRFPHRSRFGRPDDADRVEAAMARAEVVDLADRPITAVSGGERQRVLLARALAQDAPVLLLDEPTASLDVHHQVRTLELVRDLVDADGRTVVAAIHDLTLAARYCDRLVLLDAGEAVETGRPEAVLAQPALGRAFGDDAVVASHPVTGTPLVTALPGTDADRDAHVHVVGGGGSAAGVLARLDRAGFTVSLGVVPVDDPDARAARTLDVETVTVEPYASVGDAARDRAVALARDADATVLADVDLYPGNRANLAVAEASDSPVVVEARPFDERNRAGEGAASRYRRLRDRALVVDESALLRTVAAACEADGVPEAVGAESATDD